MSSLSISKLEKLLVNNNIFPERYYLYHGYIIYVECLIVKTGIKFWLDIPEDYKFKADHNSKPNIVELKSVQIDEGDEEVVNEFAKKFDDLDVFNSYENKEGGKEVEDDFEKNNISSTLNQNYKYSVKINEIDETDEKDVKDIKRQVTRLRYSVMHTKYQLCITYKHYFAILFDDEVIVFTVKHLKEDEYSKYRQLLVVVDLERFFNKVDRINVEVFKIKSSINKILDINYNKNISNINFMMDKSALVLNKFNELYSKKMHLTMLETNFDSLYKSVNESEKKILEKISLLKDQEYNRDQVEKYREDIRSLEDSKIEILSNIAKVNEKKDNISLTLDKVLFDNIVMFNSIIKNFEMLLTFSD